MPRDEHRQVVKTANQARAGLTGQGVRYVLTFGIAGVVALFVTVYLYYFA